MEYFNLLHAHKTVVVVVVVVFCYCGPTFFLGPFISYFYRPFYCRYLLPFIVFLAAVKTFGVNYGPNLEMGP